MFCKKLSSYICFTINLTIATRIIGFIGLVISLLLIIVLLNDKFSNAANYEISKTLANALGLDWQHLHPRYTIDHYVDPGGKMIIILVIFYSTLFLFINSLLILASIKGHWKLAVPWLICELLGCLSKIISLIYRYIHDREHLSLVLIYGSIIYIAVVGWWWLVILLAMLKWKETSPLETTESMQMENITSSTVQMLNNFEKKKNIPRFNPGTPMSSPGPYEPNTLYERI